MSDFCPSCQNYGTLEFVKNDREMMELVYRCSACGEEFCTYYCREEDLPRKEGSKADNYA